MTDQQAKCIALKVIEPLPPALVFRSWRYGPRGGKQWKWYVYPLTVKSSKAFSTFCQAKRWCKGHYRPVTESEEFYETNVLPAQFL
jgi:hypothetical protein